MKKTIGIIVSVAAVLALTSAGAQAAFITGDVSFVTTGVPNSVSWGTATGVNFTNGVDENEVGGSAPTGDFLGSTGTDATFTSFLFSGVPVNPLWTMTFGDNFAFNLASLNVDFQSGSFLLLSGTGMLTRNGVDATPYRWLFSGQGESGSFSASSTNINDVPEPATLTLFGLSLIGLAAGVRRRRQTAVR